MQIFGFIIDNPIGQLTGIIAMIIAFSGFLQKDDKKVLQIIMFSNTFWVIHFLFMGIYSAVVASIISVFRVFLSLKYKKNKRIFSAILVSIIVFGVMTYEDKLSLLPIVGSCISAYGYFFFEKVRLRMFIVISSIFWFTFDLNIGSIGGVINEIIVQSILIITMYKMIHEEGKRVYFIDKVMDIIHGKKEILDVSRFIVIYDYLYILKVWFIEKYKNIKNKKIKGYFKSIS